MLWVPLDVYEALLSVTKEDVTTQLQFFVRDSELRLHGSSKAGLLGFYRPDVGAVASSSASAGADEDGADEGLAELELLVRYSHAGRVFELVVADMQPCFLPSPRARCLGDAGSVS